MSDRRVWLEVGGSWEKYAKSIPDAEVLGIGNEYLGINGADIGKAPIFDADDILVCFADGTKVSLDILLKASDELEQILEIVEGDNVYD